MDPHLPTHVHLIERFLYIVIAFLYGVFFFHTWNSEYTYTYILEILNHIWLVAILLLGYSELALVCCNQGVIDSVVNEGPTKVLYCVIRLVLYGIVYVITYVKLHSFPSFYRLSSDSSMKVYTTLWMLAFGLWISTNTIIHVLLISYAKTKAESYRLRQITVIMVLSATSLTSILSFFMAVIYAYYPSDIGVWNPIFISFIALIVNQSFSEFESEYLMEQYPRLYPARTLLFTFGSLSSALVNVSRWEIWKFISLHNILPPFHKGSHEIQKTDIPLCIQQIQFDNYYGTEGICLPGKISLENCLLFAGIMILTAHLLELKYLVENMPRKQTVVEL